MDLSNCPIADVWNAPAPGLEVTDGLATLSDAELLQRWKEQEGVDEGSATYDPQPSRPRSQALEGLDVRS